MSSPSRIFALPEELVALALSLLHSREVGEVGRCGNGWVARLAGEELSSRVKPRVFTWDDDVLSCDFSPTGESAESPFLRYQEIVSGFRCAFASSPPGDYIRAGTPVQAHEVWARLTRQSGRS